MDRRLESSNLKENKQKHPFMYPKQGGQEVWELGHRDNFQIKVKTTSVLFYLSHRSHFLSDGVSFKIFHPCSPIWAMHLCLQLPDGLVCFNVIMLP